MSYTARSCVDAGEIEGSIVCLARVDAWVADVVRRLMEWEIRRGRKQKPYADTHGRMLELSVERLIRNIGVLVLHWAVCVEISGLGVGDSLSASAVDY